MRIAQFGAAFALGCSLVASPAAHASIYYVDDANGLDIPSAGSFGVPFKSINYALAFASFGDTVNVKPGIYKENVRINVDGIHLEAFPEATIEVQADPIQAVGITIRAKIEDITSATLVRGFLIDGSELLANPVSGMENIPHGIVADNFGGLVDHEISPEIQGNTIVDCIFGITVDVGGSAGTGSPQIHGNVIKPKNPGACGSQGGLYGTYLQSQTGANLTANVHSNTHLHLEAGIYVTDQSNSTNKSLIHDNLDARCEWGIYIDGESETTIMHETVAFSEAASAVPVVTGIYSASPNVSVYDSIIWVPDFKHCDGFTVIAGLDLDGPGFLGGGGAPLAFVNPNTITYDTHPSYSPLFVDPSVDDFRLAAGSPAIDSASTALILPTGPTPIPFDHDGGPRIIDPTRVGIIAADLGAFEFTTVTFDAVSAHPAYSAPPIGRTFVDTSPSAPLVLRATTQNPSDLALILVGPPSGLNLLFSTLGNMLVTPSYFITPPLIPDVPGGTTYTYTIPVPPAAAELQVDFQAVFIDTSMLGTGEFFGAFTRRVRAELSP